MAAGDPGCGFEVAYGFLAVKKEIYSVGTIWGLHSLVPYQVLASVGFTDGFLTRGSYDSCDAFR